MARTKYTTGLDRLKHQLRNAKRANNVAKINALTSLIAKRENAVYKMNETKMRKLMEKEEAEIQEEIKLQEEEAKDKLPIVPEEQPKTEPLKTTGVESFIDFKYLYEHPSATATTLRSSLLYFILVLHKFIHGDDFILKEFHLKIVEKLEQYAFKKAKKRNLYIGLPPRMGKSQIIKYFIAWTYTFNKNCNYIATSYSDTLANSISDEVKSIVESEFYKKIFGIELDYGNKSKEFWQVKGGGKFRADSLRGTLTGFGAGTMTKSREYGGAIIIDDYQKPLKAYSQADNDEVHKVYSETLKSRKNDSETPFIIIAQRISDDDLIARIMKDEEELPYWEFFILHALQDDNTSIWEERISARDLILMRDSKDTSHIFWSQYQQKPRAIGGEMIKGEWFKYYDTTESFKFKKMFAVFDTALKKGQEHDFTAGGLFGLTMDNKLLWLDLLHAKLEAPELEASIVLKWEQWQRPLNGKRCNAIYIEDKASGTTILQNIKSKYSINVFPIKVSVDKVERVNNAIPYIASGLVYLPKHNNYMVNKIVSEVETFNSKNTQKHDDITDVLCHACSIAFKKGGLF